MSFHKCGLGLAVLATAVLALSVPAAAQDDANVIASGLTAPRDLFYGADGVLWITEAGTGGDIEAQGPFGPVMTGATARVLAVAADGGEPGVVLDALPSSQGFGDILGVNAIYAANNAIWLAIGDGPAVNPFNRSVVALDQVSLRVSQFIDLYAIEARENPDGEAESIASNPIDITATEDGTFYLLDASANALYTWTIDGGLQVFHGWEDLPVPTSVALAADGSLYVGFLSAFPFPRGGARIEHWSADGELIETFDGLTGVTRVAVGADGAVYAVQLASAYGDDGWLPESGSVVMVSADGITPVAEGLNYPYGLAQAPDGSWAVTVNSAFSEPGTGMVVSIGGGM